MPAPTLIRSILAVAMLLVHSASHLAAQEGARSWSIRVAAVGLAGDHHTLWLRPGPGKEAVEVPLNTRTFSQPIQFKGRAKLAFHPSAAAAAAKKPPAPLATTVLRAKSSLLVFSPCKDNKGYEVFTVSEGDFPFGSFRFVNLSKARVRAELAGETTLLKPGRAETVAYRQARNAIPVRIHAATGTSKPRLIRQSSWSIVPTQRELVFFFPNPQNGLVRLRHFVDSKAEPRP